MPDDGITRWPVGVALCIDPDAAGAAQQLCALARDALLRELPLSVSVQCQADDALPRRFEQACRLLREVAWECGSPPRSIELAVANRGLRPAAAWLLRLRYLGPGPLSVLLDARDECALAELWQLRRNRFLRLAYAPRVLPQSPLLSHERADAVLPGAAIQVPAGTAWAAFELDVARFADCCGALRWPELELALQRCVDLGEALHDEDNWPTATMRHDAWLHRRLAIVVAGLGCLVRRRGENPKSLACLERLEGDVARMRATLCNRSQQLALRRGCLPAFEHCDPTRDRRLDAAARSFRQRWRDAVNGAAVRHRNLLVMSPWSVFPRGIPAEPAYSDLLPVVSHADACAFAQAPDTGLWNRNQFSNFHRYASALIAQSEARRQIAEQV